MAQPTKCPICDLSDGVGASESRLPNGRVKLGWDDVSCPRCGGFSINDDLIELFKEGRHDTLRGYLSCYTRQLNERNERPEPLTVQNWKEHAENAKEPMPACRDRLLLQHAPSGQPELGERVEFNVLQDYPLLSVPSPQAARLLIDDAKRRGLIDGILASREWSGSLTPEGVEQVERILDGRTEIRSAKTSSPRPAQVKKRGHPSQFETISAMYERVDKELGQGDNGFVYKVKDETGQFFALKMLKPERATGERLKRFENEVSALPRLNHKNVVRLRGVGFVPYQKTKCPFYVMELYDTTLRRLMTSISDNPPLILSYFQQILDGVAAIHEQGTFHRDLKPENVLFDRKEDRLAVADFGIAHFPQDLIATLVETQDTDRLANFQYASPEQRSRDGDVDYRTDIFSLGLMLNEMFTGEIPQGTNYQTIGQANPRYAYLDDLVGKMLEQKPERRPQSVRIIRQFLDESGSGDSGRGVGDDPKPSLLGGSTGASDTAESGPKVQDLVEVKLAPVNERRLNLVLKSKVPEPLQGISVKLASLKIWRSEFGEFVTEDLAEPSVILWRGVLFGAKPSKFRFVSLASNGDAVEFNHTPEPNEKPRTVPRTEEGNWLATIVVRQKKDGMISAIQETDLFFEWSKSSGLKPG